MAQSYSADFIKDYPKQLQDEIHTMERKKADVIAEYKRLKLGLDVKTSYEELEKVKVGIQTAKDEAKIAAEHIITSAKVEAEAIIEKANKASAKIVNEASSMLQTSQLLMAEAESKMFKAKKFDEEINVVYVECGNKVNEVKEMERSVRGLIEKTITTLRNL